jgi:hypothetical protein
MVRGRTGERTEGLRGSGNEIAKKTKGGEEMAIVISVIGLGIAFVVCINVLRQKWIAVMPAIVIQECYIDEKYSKYEGELGFYLYNVGNGPAINFEQARCSKNEIAEKMNEIPRSVIYNGNTLFYRAYSDRIIDGEFEFEVTYEDIYGVKYKTTFSNMRHCIRPLVCRLRRVLVGWKLRHMSEG